MTTTETTMLTLAQEPETRAANGDIQEGYCYFIGLRPEHKYWPNCWFGIETAVNYFFKTLKHEGYELKDMTPVVGTKLFPARNATAV